MYAKNGLQYDQDHRKWKYAPLLLIYSLHYLLIRQAANPNRIRTANIKTTEPTEIIPSLSFYLLTHNNVLFRCALGTI